MKLKWMRVEITITFLWLVIRKKGKHKKFHHHITSNLNITSDVNKKRNFIHKKCNFSTSSLTKKRSNKRVDLKA